MKTITTDEMHSIIDSMDDDCDWRAVTLRKINTWLDRGDGVAIYQNEDLGHPAVGTYMIASFGSSDAQLEVDEPPTTMPDLGGIIGWRYQLHGTYRGEHLR